MFGNGECGILRAFQLSLGMLGIIVRIKLNIIRAYSLVYESEKQSLATVMNKLEEYKKNRHFEFLFFLIQMKCR